MVESETKGSKRRHENVNALGKKEHRRGVPMLLRCEGEEIADLFWDASSDATNMFYNKRVDPATAQSHLDRHKARPMQCHSDTPSQQLPFLAKTPISLKRNFANDSIQKN